MLFRSVCIPVSLAPGERLSHTLALAAGDDPAAVREGALRMLDGQEGGPVLLSSLVRKLALSEREALEAFDLLSRLEGVEDRADRLPQSALWPFGISGDLPIAAGRASGEDQVDQAALWCRWHQLLTRAGYSFDLILLLEEGGDYRRPLRSALTEELKKMGAQSVLDRKSVV